MSELMTTAQVSALTGIPAETLRYYRWKGTGPVSFKLGRAVVYERAEVITWMAQRKAKTAVGGAA
jgi:predicted DNA-binding transcriptional regulator AlpA